MEAWLRDTAKIILHSYRLVKSNADLVCVVRFLRSISSFEAKSLLKIQVGAEA